MINNFSMYHFFQIGKFFLDFPPHKLTSRSAVYVNLLSTATRQRGLQWRVAKFVKNFKQFFNTLTRTFTKKIYLEKLLLLMSFITS
jgi:hypothetical protein